MGAADDLELRPLSARREREDGGPPARSTSARGAPAAPALQQDPPPHGEEGRGRLQLAVDSEAEEVNRAGELDTAKKAPSRSKSRRRRHRDPNRGGGGRDPYAVAPWSSWRREVGAHGGSGREGREAGGERAGGWRRLGCRKSLVSPGMQHGREASANCRTGWGNRWRPYSVF
jgi:hypothetical protein